MASLELTALRVNRVDGQVYLTFQVWTISCSTVVSRPGGLGFSFRWALGRIFLQRVDLLLD